MTRSEGAVDLIIEVRLLEGAQDVPGGVDSHEWLAQGVPKGAIVLAGPPDKAPPAGFLQFAIDAIAHDPRVASVSWADSAIAHLSGQLGRNRLAAPRDHPSGYAHAQCPAGDLVVLNPEVFDLVGLPIGEVGTISLPSIRDWSRRANHRGLRHLWWWSGGTSEDGPRLPPTGFDEHESQDPSSAIGMLIDQHRAQFDAISIAVDASWLGDHETGAQVATVEWLNALARRTDIAEIRLVNLPSDRLPHYAVELSAHPAIRVIPKGTVPDRSADVFWRPNQPDHRTVLTQDRRDGRRLVTTVLDLIAYANERYHADEATWAWNRHRTRVYLSRIDMVTGISQDVVEHLAAEVPTLERRRLRETSLGVGHLAHAHVSSVPYELSRIWPTADEAPFLLVLGNDFMHKNRDFAIRIWQRIAQRRRIDLVLAGLNVRGSSTHAIEQTLLHSPYVNGSQVFRLAHVSPAAKTWLLANAEVLLYPSSAEGFGFVPHEAASLGIASLSTGFGPLREFLPANATIDHWSIDDYVERVLSLIDDADTRRAQLAAFESVRQENSWDGAAEQLARAFREALRLPPRMPSTAQSARAGDLEALAEEDEAAAVRAMTESLSWRITKPLRTTAVQARRIKRRLR